MQMCLLGCFIIIHLRIRSVLDCINKKKINQNRLLIFLVVLIFLFFPKIYIFGNIDVRPWFTLSPLYMMWPPLCIYFRIIHLLHREVLFCYWYMSLMKEKEFFHFHQDQLQIRFLYTSSYDIFRFSFYPNGMSFKSFVYLMAW